MKKNCPQLSTSNPRLGAEPRSVAESQQQSTCVRSSDGVLSKNSTKRTKSKSSEKGRVASQQAHHVLQVEMLQLPHP